MIKKEIIGIDLNVYYEKLDNGLEIYLVPFSNRKNYYIEYGVKYGAKTNEFETTDGKRIKAPYGIAHFLEHKMFEQEDGMDPFSYFSLSGSDANASTGYDVTSYTVEGIKNIEENLEFLLNYVNSPYFTDENVEKEKNIIIEEINMYKDQPENKLYEESNKSIFLKHPLRIDIGGTEKSVNRITKEILYDCYNTFYQPNNMFLLISGNFDYKRIYEIIKNNKKLQSRKKGKPVKIYNVNEPLNVKTKEKENKIKNMLITKSILSFKNKIQISDNIEKYKYEISLSILLYILFGMSSEFREDVYKNEMCSLFYSSCSIVDDLLIIEFLSETKKPYDLKEKIIECLKNKEITKKDVDRVKKVKISLEVINSDKPHKVINSIVKDIIDYGDVLYNKVDLIKSISLKDIENARKDILLDNYSHIIGIPK